MIREWIKKDTIGLGIALGMLVPPVLFFIIYQVNELLQKQSPVGKNYLDTGTIMLVSIVLNLFVLRQFLVKKDREKSGRGVLLATFLYALIFAFFFFKSF